jgi:hypothetical protein
MTSVEYIELLIQAENQVPMFQTKFNSLLMLQTDTQAGPYVI